MPHLFYIQNVFHQQSKLSPKAIQVLLCHDIAAYDQEKWRISIAPLAPKAIELFRRWVIDRLQ